ncbi:MAG: hypothetical protein WCF18_11720 [Chthoniobacteraceae bacterium]
MIAVAARTFRALLVSATLTAWTLIPLPLCARALITLAARLAGALRTFLCGTTAMFAVPFHFSALTPRAISVMVRPVRAWPFTAPAFAGAAAFAFAGRPHLIGSDAAIAVAVELLEKIDRVLNFLFVDRAVVIGIERAEDSRHRALGAAAGCAFAARSAFALRWLGRALRWVRLIFLREERGRREGERHGREESAVLFHGFVECYEFRGCGRGMRRAFIGQNAASRGFCLP